MSIRSSAVVHPGRGRLRRPRSLGWLCWLVAAQWGLIGVSQAAGPPSAPSTVRYGRPTRTVRAGGNELKAELDQARAAAAKGAEGPSTTVDPVPRQRQDITLSAIDDQIRLMRALLEEAGPGDKDYPSYLFRFADLHLDRKGILEHQAGALYESIHALEQGGRKEAARIERARQQKLEKMARVSSEAAVEAYAKIADGKRWAGYKRMDEALYYLAFELGQLGREAQMQEVFVRLLRDHPTSRFVPQVYISFGDQKLASGEVADAGKLYQRVIDGYADSPVYAYALYKSAWCHLNPMGSAEPDYARALQRFVDTIEATLEGRAGSEANGAQLRRDARRDLVLAYAHAGKPTKAWEFFRKVGRGPTADQDMDREMMVRLAAAYFGEGMYVESTATYHRLHRELPNDDDRCEWQYRVVINTLASDDKQIQWREAERLGQQWAEARDGELSKGARRRCRDHAHDTLQQLASVWHEEGDKTHRPETFALADRAYAEYLRQFPGAKAAYEMQYWQGELKWQQAELLYSRRDRASQRQGLALFLGAHDAFVRVLEMKPKGKFSGEAAYAQMLSMKNYLEYDETRGQGRGCEVRADGTCVYQTDRRQDHGREPVDASSRFPVTPYTDDETKMLEAYARFDAHAEVAARAHPDEAPKILFHRAMLMVAHNRFDEARPVLDELVNAHDGTVFSVWGAEMLLDVLTIAWADRGLDAEAALAAAEELDAWGRKVQSMKLWKHDEAANLRAHVPDVLMSVGWGKAVVCGRAAATGEDLEGYDKCARQYLAVYEEFPEHDRADELLFNAARCFEADFQLGHAIQARKALLEWHPDSELAQQTLRELGGNYHAIAFYSDAAERYEQYAERYDEDEFAGDALENAFLFRLGLGQQPQATADLERYEALYRRKDPSRAAGIFWARHELLEAPDERLAHAEGYIRTYGSKGGVDRLAVAHAIAGQVLWRKSCPKALLGDVCISVSQRRATAGEGTRQHAADLRRRNDRGRRRDRGIPERCGQDTQGVVTVHRRDPKLAQAAQAHFRQVLALGNKAQAPADEPERVGALHDAVGMAMVYRTDASYEDYLRIDMPENLDFHLEDWKKDSGHPRLEREYRLQLARVEDTRARFKAFFDAKAARRDELIEGYGKVLQSKSPHWVLASAARSAVVYQNFADQLYRAEVPRSLETEEAYDDYCFGLADYAEPLQQAATEALGYCLERSTTYQYFNEFSRMCEEQLQQRAPDRYPATNELLGRSRYTHARMDRPGVQVELETTAAVAVPGGKTEGELGAGVGDRR